MKATTVAGIALLLFAMVGLAIRGFTFTNESNELRVGPLKVTNDVHETVATIPLAVTAVALVGGVVLVVIGARSR